ncbi:MAG: hypothetical protein WCG87_11930 [Bacteroidota bacterium]
MYVKFNNQAAALYQNAATQKENNITSVSIVLGPVYALQRWMRIRAINKRIRKVQIMHNQHIWDIVHQNPNHVSIQRKAYEQHAIARMERFKIF